MCSYLVNARKKPKKKKNENKYSYNVRYYLTSAKVTLIESPHKTFVKPKTESNIDTTSMHFETTTVNQQALQVTS